MIVVETTATAASTVAQAGATQAQSTSSQPSVPLPVASGNTNTGVTTSNVVLTTGSIVNPIPVAAPPPMTDQSTHPPSVPLVPIAVPPTVPPTMRNCGVSPTSTFHLVAASTFAQAPTSPTFSFSGAGPPCAELPPGGGGSYVCMTGEMGANMEHSTGQPEAAALRMGVSRPLLSDTSFLRRGMENTLAIWILVRDMVAGWM